MSKIPPSVIGTSAPILAQSYTHDQLNALFLAHGFPGDPPEGSKVAKCMAWLRKANNECANPLVNFGKLIAEFIDAEITESIFGRERLGEVSAIATALAREGLSYHRGGFIFGASLSGPSRSLAVQLSANGIDALNQEYDRACKFIDSDPPAAVTAACAILETVCKTFLEAEGLALPAKQVLGSLWQETAKHLRLHPGQLADNDLKRILQGLNSIADHAYRLSSGGFLGIMSVNKELAHDAQARRSLA